MLVATPGSCVQAQDSRRALAAFSSDSEVTTYLRTLMESRARVNDSIQALSDSIRGCRASLKSRTARAGERSAVVVARLYGLGGALQGAFVVANALGIAAMSQEDGTALLRIPAERVSAAGELGLLARRIGFKPNRFSLSLAAGDSVDVDFRLCGEFLYLDEVVVTAADASVTNVQQTGVDEGGIVKLSGDFLVMLRRGKLYTVKIGGGVLEPIESIDAFGPGLGGAWYDELLIAGDRVVVIGYSYERGGTEIGLFRMDRRGRLRYESTHHLRSYDYYSSRNYASRLIGDKLVFYAPTYLPQSPLATSHVLPAMRTWRGRGQQPDFSPIVTARRIYRPAAALDPLDQVSLHTVTECDLGSRNFTCRATVLLGPPGRVFYVSARAVYVWTSGYARRSIDPTPNSAVYRMPLDGSAPSALGVTGTPVDQFSFFESDDGHLNVVVHPGVIGEGMWGSETRKHNLSLLRVPLSHFGDGTATAPDSSYRWLARNVSGTTYNRFVGDYVLVGSGNGWGLPSVRSSRLYAAPWRGGAVSELPLPHGVDRIEPMGSDAVIVGSDSSDLYFTGIRFGDEPRVQQQFMLPRAAQGELRSHGFFYKPADRATGVFGLPVRPAGRPGYRHLHDESAAILFVRNTGQRFDPIGQLVSDGATAAEKCEDSCVDWYGNSRPLFVRGRTFALLGSELVEAREEAGRLREVRRVNYVTPRR